MSCNALSICFKSELWLAALAAAMWSAAGAAWVLIAAAFLICSMAALVAFSISYLAVKVAPWLA